MTMSLYFAFETVRVRERVINVLLPKINFAMPQYYTQVSKMSAARRPENKTLPSCRVRTVQKRNMKRRLDDSVSEARAAKQFISEEKMANYLQGLHIANETHHHSGVSEVCNPTRQELLNRRLQGDDGTDDAFYSPPSSVHRTMDSSDFKMNQAVPGSDSSTNTKQTSQSHWEVIIEDLSSDDDELELKDKPTIELSPEVRENLSKTHLLPPSIIDELCSKPCMELIPWVPKEKIVQDSLRRSSLVDQMESSSVSQQVSNQTDTTVDSSSRGQVKEVLWGFDDEDDDMEL
ncbi:uncharacterized protein [Dysidea avara]|uniref:uncharacterized protein n=1 Tax=Dysidea avara TaxID=196820 RepID=UPI003318DA7E